MKQINLKAIFGDTQSEVYSFNIKAGDNGSLNTGDVSITGSPNTIVKMNIFAEPNEGYMFSNWSDGIVSQTRNFNQSISNTTITANFKPLETSTYKIYYLSSNNSNPDPGRIIDSGNSLNSEDGSFDLYFINKSNLLLLIPENTRIQEFISTTTNISYIEYIEKLDKYNNYYIYRLHFEAPTSDSVHIKIEYN